MRAGDALLAAFAACIWSGAFIATEAALRDCPPILFAALRFCLSALALPFLARPHVSWRALLALGLLIGVGQHVGIFIGMATGVTPGMAALLAHTQSFFTLALAWGLMGEALTPRKLCGFAAALGGLVLLMAERGTPMPPLAIAIVLGGALAGGLGNFVLRRIGGADPIGVAAWLSAVAAPLLGAMNFHKSGKLRIIAITSRSRVPTLPDVPTVGETVPGYEFYSWYGLWAPAGAPAEVVARLNAEANKALAGDLRDRLVAQGLIVNGGSVADIVRFQREDMAKSQKIITEGNIRAQ
jgi:hypothetical protein